MRNIKFRQMLTFCILLMTKTIVAQIPAIDSLKIIPLNPTINDEIKIICYATFPAGDCDLTNHFDNFQGNNINVNLNYTVGENTAICHSIDTLTIGTLNAGNYELTANLTIGLLQAIFDTDTIEFYVTNPLIISEIENHLLIDLYPNPFNGQINLQCKCKIETIDIYSTLGQKIIALNKISGETEKLDLSNLQKGVYYVIITDNQQRRYAKKIIKNSP